MLYNIRIIDDVINPCTSHYTVTNQQTTNSSVNVPDGPFNPTNYSGTQLNFWGVAPPGGVPMPAGNGWSAPYGNPAQIGPTTSNMLAVCILIAFIKFIHSFIPAIAVSWGEVVGLVFTSRRRWGRLMPCLGQRM